jgi:uncharacterized protein (TIGR02271 family)
MFFALFFGTFPTSRKAVDWNPMVCPVSRLLSGAAKTKGPMKEYACLIAAAALFAGCASSGTGSSARYESGATGITPLEGSRQSSMRSEIAPSDRESQSLRASERAGEFTEIPLHREELQIGTRLVPQGEVVIRKIVNTQTTNVPMQLRREEIVIERVQPGERAAVDRGEIAPFREGEMVIELNREVPVTQKEVVVTEIIRAGKRVETEQQNVGGEIRTERVEIVRSGERQPDNQAVGGPASVEVETSQSQEQPRE